MSKSLVGRERDGVLYIHFNNSARRNCFGERQADELMELLAKSKSYRGLIWSHEGAYFCSGGNLKDYANKSGSETRQVNQKIRQALERLADWPHPTVALVTGDCLGGGLELLSCFDWVGASPECLFAFWQRRIGLTFGWGGGQRLLRRLREQSLRQLYSSTQYFSSYRALNLGLIDRVGDHKSLSKWSSERVNEQKTLPTRALEEFKGFFGRKDETEVFEELWLGDDHRRSLKTFIGRRKN